MTELLQTLVEKHPTGTIDVASDYEDMQADHEGKAVVRATAGWLVLL